MTMEAMMTCPGNTHSENTIKIGNKYRFIPKGLSDVEKIVTVECDPFFNGVVNDTVVKVKELFGLCPVKSLYPLT